MAALLWKATAIAVVAGGVVVSGLLVGWAGSPEQCPDGFSQAQIDASDCIVGANIGLGLAWIFAVPLIVATALLVGVRAWQRSSESAPPRDHRGGRHRRIAD
jgi:hypothetical protein